MEEKNSPLINNPLIATNIKLNYAKKFLLVSISFLLVFFGGAKTASAASLYFSPESGSSNIGQTFSLGVYVSSADQVMNAASGVISFPQDKLEVSSLSQNGSIVSLWVQEPSFSNNAGIINFEGIVLNPGFKGLSGKIVTISFKAKSVGTASINFASGLVLANDGKGTNILKTLGSAVFNLDVPISGPAAAEAITPSGVAGAPPAPEISSSTHPDPNKWYSSKTAKFSWKLSSDVSSVRLLVGKNPQAVPTVVYTPPISSKEISGLADGIWYFNVQLSNSSGWGAISHFRFQIDSEPPEPFSIEIIDGKETENPRPTVVFDTVDKLSGIDHYKIKIGESDFVVLSEVDIKRNPYTLPLQKPGKRYILVQAFDRAENYSTASEEFIIKPIKAPVITDYPEELKLGQPLIVKGETYPDSEVTIWLEKENETSKKQTVKSDQNGKFTLIYVEKLAEGIYKMRFEVVDSRGASSEQTEEIVFVVSLPAGLKLGQSLINYLTLIVSLAVLIAALMFLVIYSWRKIYRLRRGIKKETREAKEKLESAFAFLRKTIKEQITGLDGKPGLSPKEKKFCDKLKKALEKSEEIIGKEIKDIEKKIK